MNTTTFEEPHRIASTSADREVVQLRDGTLVELVPMSASDA